MSEPASQGSLTKGTWGDVLEGHSSSSFVFGDDGTVAIDAVAADTLDVSTGDNVWSAAR